MVMQWFIYHTHSCQATALHTVWSMPAAKISAIRFTLFLSNNISCRYLLHRKFYAAIIIIIIIIIIIKVKTKKTKKVDNINTTHILLWMQCRNCGLQGFSKLNMTPCPTVCLLRSCWHLLFTDYSLQIGGGSSFCAVRTNGIKILKYV